MTPSASVPSHHILSSADFITNIAETNFWYTQGWMPQTADDLLGQCNEAIRTGADFPTVWQTILRRSELVVGMPVQRMSSNRAQLQVRLFTGQSLVFDSTSKRFSIE